MSESKRAERAPWNDFPPVIRNGDLKELEKEPEYQATKSGDWGAALAMAERLVRPETVDHRLAMNPSFDGEVERGQPYVLVDDTLTMGETMASLRGYIENRGGQVLGAAVMTAHPGALDIAIKPKMLADIERKHGQAMNDYWRKEFGYPIEQLTQGEAGHLRAAPTVDAIRDRIAAARDSAGWTVDERTTGEATSESPSVKRGPHQEKAS